MRPYHDQIAASLYRETQNFFSRFAETNIEQQVDDSKHLPTYCFTAEPIHFANRVFDQLTWYGRNLRRFDEQGIVHCQQRQARAEMRRDCCGIAQRATGVLGEIHRAQDGWSTDHGWPPFRTAATTLPWQSHRFCAHFA